jgi:hypothetical protein
MAASYSFQSDFWEFNHLMCRFAGYSDVLGLDSAGIEI